MKTFHTEEDFLTARDATLDILLQYKERVDICVGATTLEKLAMDIVSAIARSDIPVGDISEVQGVHISHVD